MLERFNALVHQVYEGCTDPSAWPRITAAVTQYMEAEKGLLLTPAVSPDRGGFIFPHEITPDHISLWKARYIQHDFWAQRAAERGLLQEGNAILGQDLTSDEELLETTWYREFLSRMDIFRIVCGIVFAAGECPFTSFAFYRGRKAAPFDELHRARIRMLVPHISRALGVMLRLRDAEFRVAASLHALNQIRQGILLLDDDGSACFANSAAERILQEQDGVHLTSNASSRRTLVADDPVAQAALERALQGSLLSPAADVSHFAQTIPVRRPSGSSSYAVQVSFLPESNPYRFGAVTPRAVVFIRDGAQTSQANPGLLRRVYGLTPAEARAAIALCDGGALDAVAAQLNIKLNTLKTHVKSIYVKTSVENRAALTKLMLSLSSE